MNMFFPPKRFAAMISREVTVTRTKFRHVGQGKCYYVTVELSGYLDNYNNIYNI